MRYFFVLCLWGAASLGAGAQVREASSCGAGLAQPCQQAAGPVIVAQLGEACGSTPGGCNAAADRAASAPQAMAASAPDAAPAPSWDEYGQFLLTGILAIALVTVLGRRLY